MSRSALYFLRRSPVVIGAVALLAGCIDDGPVVPEGRRASPVRFTASAADVDLGACDYLQVPEPSILAFRVFAKGVQIYHWNGASWTFDGPLADLSSDADGNSRVGTHYAGPTWESVSGSKVVGTVLRRCTPDPSAVAWLLLGAVSNEGPGIFENVTHIQRVNTVGGNPPANAGSFTGEEARVPYTTEYFFYRAQ